MSDQLIQLFSETLEIDPVDLSDDSSPDTIASWDSLAAMMLVGALESSFQVRLSTKEIMNMNTIGLARKALRDKGVDV